jgi:hypothetical protein
MRENRINEAAEHLLEVLHDINTNIENAQIHRTEILEKLEKIEKELEQIKNAFPSGDPHGHRAYHEKMMREQEHSTKIKEQIFKEVVQKGILIVISLIVGALGLKFGFNFMGIG